MSIFAGIKTLKPMAVPVITKLCRLAKIRELVNEIVLWREDNSKISPGLLIETLIISIFCGRMPLWKVHQFWAEQDLSNLFPDVELSIDQLNEHAYGRALDKLAEVDLNKLISLVSLVMLDIHNLDISTVHLDTTSISVEGIYDVEPYNDFTINRGHSKDLRPDLKQFKIGAAVQQNGQVVMGEMLSGNKSDNKWNPEAALKMKEFFDTQGYRDVVFVGDCALISNESLANLTKKNVQFISRLPETYNLAKELKTLAWAENAWHDLGIVSEANSKKASHYRTYLVHHELEGHPYDFVVVHSSSLEAQKAKTLQKRIGKQKEELTKQSKGLKTKAFACEPDAQAALAVFLQECQQKGFEVQGTVQSCVKKSYGHRGKPRNGEEPTITTTYHAEVSIGDIKPEVYQHLLQMESTFVLIANVKDRQKYDDQGILLEYKRQSSIETKFRFLKNRVYLGPVYLENPKRIYALGYVFILVLLLASYLEYRVRKALKEQGEAVKLPGNKSTDRPSVQTILEVLGTIQIVSIQGQRYFPDNVNRQALNMVRWAGFNPEEIYLKPISLNA